MQISENIEVMNTWRMRMYKSKRNNWYNRAKREWRKNSDAYIIQFVLIFIAGAWMFAIVVVGVN